MVLGQCTDYLRLKLESQEKWEKTSNERDLIALISSVKSLAHKYDEDTEFHHVVYHTFVRQFMLFKQGDSSNSEYKQRFWERLDVMETYNGGGGDILLVPAQDVPFALILWYVVKTIYVL